MVLAAMRRKMMVTAGAFEATKLSRRVALWHDEGQVPIMTIVMYYGDRRIG